MERSSSHGPDRAMAGMLAAVLLVTANGCHGQSPSAERSTAATVTPASGAAGGSIGALALPTLPPTGAPNTNPTMDPELAAAFSPEAEAGGTIGKPVDPHTLTPTELQFGRPPKRDPSVTYQPDVLIMEHGDTALRSMESNGIIWHFDATAPQVDQIAQGKIIFATERCVGRVGAIKRNGDDVAVVLEPVQLTDIIQQGHFVYNQPLDLNSVVAAPVPDIPVQFKQDVLPSTSPGASPSTAPSATTGYVTRHLRLASVTYAVVTAAGRWKPFRMTTYDAHGHIGQRFLQPTVERVAQAGPVGGTMPTGIPAPPPGIGEPAMRQVNVTGMSASPCLTSCGGLGIELKYSDRGLDIDAYSVFYLSKPNINFNVDIDLSGIKLAGIWINGVGGFKTAFVAASHQGFRGNIHVTQPIPVDATLPVNFIAPIGVHLNADLKLDSGFSAKDGLLTSSIDFQVCCQIAVSYLRGSRWHSWFPQIDVKTPQANVSGVSVGINSLVFGMSQQLLVGLGFAGFATGPYVGLTEGMTALKQSSTTWVDCRQATLDMQLDAGVGYTMPAIVTSIINVFLTLANAAPISNHGSLVKMPSATMLQYKGSLPKDCAGKG
jgi:hypothetical protein